MLKLLTLPLILFAVYFSDLGLAHAQLTTTGDLVIKDPLKVQTVQDKIQIQNQNPIVLDFDLSLPPKYHVYSDSIKINILKSKSTLVMQSLNIKPEIEFYDKFSKRTRKGIQEKAELQIKMMLKNLHFEDEHEIQLDLTYQACSDQFCLLPTHKTITQAIELKTAEQKKITFSEAIGSLSIEDLIRERSWLAFLFIFFAGILTSFTPCIFPMIPITLSILGSQTITESSGSRKKSRGFLVSLLYVHGIATTYSLLGLLAAKTGTLFGSLLSNPIAVVTIALIFVLMALSLFDVYEIQVPIFIRSRLGNKKVSQNYVGAYISGLIAGLVASPCVGPVLVALLAYVAQSRNMFLGFTLLFTYAMGLGLIFIVLGTFSHLLVHLPRSGPWMVRVKKAFGVILILMACYYVYPLAKNYFMMTTMQTKDYQGWHAFTDQKLKENLGKNVIIIDFFADWCEACAELDKYTYSNLEVKAKLSHAVLLKVDATQENATVTPVLQKYGVVGLPTVIFIEKDGTVRTDLSLTGYEPPADFLRRLEKINSL